MSPTNTVPASNDGGPRSLVMRTAGTNCDAETVLALERAGSPVDRHHLHRILREPSRLDDYAILALPGGFSYGDDIAAGRVYGLEVRHALAEALAHFVDRGGLVLGICNGFQVLVESGLLESAPPGRDPSEREIALSQNQSHRFECRWVNLRSEDCACPWLEAGELLPCPAAHAEGRLVVRDDAVLERLRSQGQIALRYVTLADDGTVGPADYPDCPNGAVEQIAGLCDPTGRVLGLMPHPERNLEPWHHPEWTRRGARSVGEGQSFYDRLVAVAARGAVAQAR